jgi:hypothetical protein
MLLEVWLRCLPQRNDRRRRVYDSHKPFGPKLEAAAGFSSLLADSIDPEWIVRARVVPSETGRSTP